MQKQKKIKNILFFALIAASVLAAMAAYALSVPEIRGRLEEKMQPAAVERTEYHVLPNKDVFTSQTLYANELDCYGDSLYRVVALSEGHNEWSEVLPYVFVGEKQTGYETADYEAARDILYIAKDQLSDEVDLEIQNDYMTNCVCIQSERFVILVGAEKYMDMVTVFEQNADLYVDITDLVKVLLENQNN